MKENFLVDASGDDPDESWETFTPLPPTCGNARTRLVVQCALWMAAGCLIFGGYLMTSPPVEKNLRSAAVEWDQAAVPPRIHEVELVRGQRMEIGSACAAIVRLTRVNEVEPAGVKEYLVRIRLARRGCVSSDIFLIDIDASDPSGSFDAFECRTWTLFEPDECAAYLRARPESAIPIEGSTKWHSSVRRSSDRSSDVVKVSGLEKTFLSCVPSELRESGVLVQSERAIPLGDVQGDLLHDLVTAFRGTADSDEQSHFDLPHLLDQVYRDNRQLSVKEQTKVARAILARVMTLASINI